jgi:hypothetical protein
VDEKLKPLIKLAQEGFIELFFVDASHFVMGGFAGTLWSRVRCFVKTAWGRSRYNVRGVLNAAYHGTFEEFKRTIDDCVSGGKGKYKKETASLVSENFQLFTDVFIPAA